MEQAEIMKSQAFDFDINTLAPEELQEFIFGLFAWRDSIFKEVLKTISFIPGLTSLFESLTEALNACELFNCYSGLQASANEFQSFTAFWIRYFRYSTLITPLKCLLNHDHVSLFCKTLSQAFSPIVKKLSTPMSNMK